MSAPERWAHSFTDDEIVALDFATRLCTVSHDLGGELIERLTAAYDERQVAELVLMAGMANMSNLSGAAARQLLGRR